jgi:hypothetical protein
MNSDNETFAGYYADQGIEDKADHDFNPKEKPMNKEWRPSNPLKGVMVIDHSFEHGKYLGYEEGASAMLEALIKWLFEPCTEHPTDRREHTISKPHKKFPEWYFTNRRYCPDCMKQIKKELNIQ